MTYGQGNIAAAADFNLIRDSVDQLYGVGTGDSGYGQNNGQPGIYPASVASSGIILSSDWLAVDTALSTMNTHQGTSYVTIPSAGQYAPTAIVKAYPPNGFDLSAAVTSLTSTRLQVSPIAFATAVQVTSTRVTLWQNSLTLDVTCTSASEDAARWFFNAGGKVQFVLSRTGGTGGNLQNANWTSLFTAVGTVSFSANGSTVSGTSSSINGSLGYYQLTASYQNLLNEPGTGLYAANLFTVKARSNNIVGLRGAKGSILEFQVVLNDLHPGSPPKDQVDGTTSCSVQTFSGTTFPFQYIPAFSTVTGFPAGT